MGESKIDYLKSLYETYGDFRIHAIFKYGDKKNWVTDKMYSECSQEELLESNLRMQMPDEVFPDCESKEEYNTFLIKAKKNKLNLNCGIWNTGSRGFHIPVTFSELKDFEDEIKIKIRELLIEFYGTDISKKSGWVALEYANHFKTGIEKKLIKKPIKKNNKIPNFVWDKLEKEKEIKDLPKFEVNNNWVDKDPLLHYVLANQLKSGLMRNNVVLKNLCCACVSSGLNENEINELGKRVIKNMLGKQIGEWSGWIRKVKKDDMEFNPGEINKWVEKHNLAIEKYEIKKKKDKYEIKPCYHSGKINNELYFDLVFKQEEGNYIPKVILSNGVVLEVVNYKKELKKAGIEEVENIDDYDFFIYKNIKYKFYAKMFFNDRLKINTPNNDVFDMIKDTSIINDKKIYDDLKNLKKDFWDHFEENEYDIENVNVIQSYLKRKVRKIMYKIYQGKEDTGKSTAQKFNALTKYRGRFAGKGTVAVNARLIHYLDIGLEQDEMDKMGKDESQQFLGILNNGLYVDGTYSFVNMAKRNIEDQIVVLDVFGDKSFSTNDLYLFDKSFLSRCDITITTRQSRKLKDINDLTQQQLEEFQDIRNKLFIYCLVNAESIKQDVLDVKEELEQEGVFGRRTDINSLILGIIKHFKGEHYLKVKKYLKIKQGITDIENTQNKDYLVLEYLTEKFTQTEEFIDVVNKEVTDFVNEKLGLADSKRKIGFKTIGKIIRDYNLIRNLGDAGRKSKGYTYTIHKKPLLDALSRFKLGDLKNKIKKSCLSSDTNVHNVHNVHKVHSQNEPNEPNEPNEHRSDSNNNKIKKVFQGDDFL